ncbi:type VI secretion system baseplate subunit TssG [Candidatus Halocynthiibacter alkanivorans]|uniref:type VI secretion system baseplate subunit TssG n=1 Tax=Candidatus Halocynthiibacter alkanivorans TaxID=2267619 RepID=UPI000DF3EB8D|nr:type VI secretion system baseplate subunit TssG [Candidatus Halocynthiibacter alkanivorans]
METRERARTDDLTHFKRLIDAPEKHHFFHALRVIEAQYQDAPRLGLSRRPSQDPVRFGQEAELQFPPSSIAAFHPPQAAVAATGDAPARPGAPGVLTNRFFGFFGPQGPLPLHLTEYARDRKRNFRDSTFIAFADMLTHRFTSLFYRAWRAGQPAPSFDRPGQDEVQDHIAAFAGLHGRDLRERDAMPELAKRHFTAHLASGSKHPEGLISILSGFFNAPVRLQQFVGSWLELEPGDRWQLGAPAGLGQTTSIGDRVWSRSAKFRLRVGPLSLEAYKRLLPSAASLERLSAIVRNYVGDTLDWDLNLVLLARDVPPAVLGQDTRLGHTSWIGDPAADGRDAVDLYLAPVHRPAAAPPATVSTRSAGPDIHIPQVTSVRGQSDE